MTDQSSIKYISGLLENPGTISDADHGRIMSLHQSYPYLVPVRYLKALESHRHSPFSASMMAEVNPYLGNWILFCGFLEDAPQSPKQATIKPGAVTHNNDAWPEDPIEITQPAEENPLIFPVYTGDYFSQENIVVPDTLPKDIPDAKQQPDKSLMVVMSFSEWLLHFKNTAEKQKEEKTDQKSLRTMWQKEKLAAAMEEENEEIPENVFEMAVNSISKEDGLASESLANIYIKQKKYDAAIEMYRKLSLLNPKKNTYFARKIEEILKEKQS